MALAGESTGVAVECSLVEKQGDVFFVAGSRLAGLYGVPSAVEGYHCSYGLNANYAAHPFFFGTLYQPERSGLDGRRHPLITAFVSAASRAGR